MARHKIITLLVAIVVAVVALVVTADPASPYDRITKGCYAGAGNVRGTSTMTPHSNGTVTIRWRDTLNASRSVAGPDSNYRHKNVQFFDANWRYLTTRTGSSGTVTVKPAGRSGSSATIHVRHEWRTTPFARWLIEGNAVCVTTHRR